MPSTGADAARAAAAQLEALARDLARRGYSAQRVSLGPHQGILVANRAVPELAETIRVAPVLFGDWWFWWSWNDPIAPASDVDAAAFKIASVLSLHAPD